MKKLNFLVICFILFISKSYVFGQWIDISPSGNSNVTLFDVAFIDDNIGFAVGQNTGIGLGYIY
ncbi:hypothetical protein ACFLRZ_02590 [Bacteroidota bacterium]